MNLQNLNKILANQPKYRFKQINEAVFSEFIESWDEATSLPKPLREELKESCSLEIEAKMSQSQDAHTRKALLTLDDGEKIETVLMLHKDNRATVCVSSQVGCKLACKFCATGQMGFKRDLTSDEIIEQVLFFARELHKEDRRVSNVVFMGMGEPFLNYDNVMTAIRFLNSEEGFNIGARHISVSTIGVVEAINKFKRENLQINLAISLHAPNDDLRSELMPINKKYPLKNILKSVNEYIDETGRKVMFEYLLMDSVNDSVAHARELATLMQNQLYMVNIIPCNPVGEYKASSPKKVKMFREILTQGNVNNTERSRFGREIDAACGQLANKS